MKNILFFLLTVSSILVLSSCSSIGLLSENSSLFPQEINDFSDFIGVWFYLQISIILVGLLVGIFLGETASNISTLLHFIWIVSYRDYGFWTVFGLMIFLQVILMLAVPFLIGIFRKE